MTDAEHGHGQDPAVVATCVFSILTALILITIVFEKAKEAIFKRASKVRPSSSRRRSLPA